jgi:hypothetical protein
VLSTFPKKIMLNLRQLTNYEISQQSFVNLYKLAIHIDQPMNH